MAIYLTDKDGSDQHFDTYAEFEQAMVLMSRIGGNKVPQDLLDEVKARNSEKEVDEELTYTLNVDTSEILAKLDEEIAKLKKSEPVGKDSNGEDLYEGDYVTGTEANPYGITNSNAICEVESESDVKVIQTTDDDVKQYEGESFKHIDLEEFVKLSDNLGEAKAKFDELNGVELKDFPTEFRPGDIVLVTETFEDSYGDALLGGDLHRFGKLSSGRVCISAVFVDGNNLDKLRLVCRREDRKDIEI